MRKEATTTEPLFKNETERLSWTYHNCSRCWRRSRWSESKNDWENNKCSVDRDINQQLSGVMLVTARSKKIAANDSCPNRQESRPEHTRKYTKNKKD